ncbi:MAG: pyridoxamine 5'-phosphate oxidase family protein [Bernardetiaceae bacterium]|nr:pyridoxamine 5'-phosphate oxidase family protein [Bernardetiaceae bacterium]
MQESTPTSQDYYQKTWQQLRRATADKRHPFRYFTLASTDSLGQAQQRVVALRKIDNSRRLWIYTDYRTQKIADFKQNPHASLLFFHPKKWLQLRLQARAQVHYQDEVSRQIWNALPAHSRKDYTTAQAPATPMTQDFDEVAYLDTENYFCRLSFEIETIELLQIRREGHHRLLFSDLQSEQEATAEWLIP